MDTKGERGWGDKPGDWYGHMHITDTVHKVDRASLTAPWVKNSPAMQETWIAFLGWEDPLEAKQKKTKTKPSILSFCLFALVYQITLASCISWNRGHESWEMERLSLAVNRFSC